MTTRIAVLLLVLTALAAQAFVESIYEPKNSPINIGKEVTAEAVKLAFMSAPGEIPGWSFEDKEPGKLVGTLKVRSHEVVVDILYTGNEYSILYVSSEKMNYDKVKRTIHTKYETWIKNLERLVIKKLASSIAPTPSVPATTTVPATPG